MLFTFFRSIWVILRKDLRVWIRQPVTLAATFLPSISFLLVGALGAAAVGRSPVALVTLDTDPKGMQMAQIFHSADVFRITESTWPLSSLSRLTSPGALMPMRVRLLMSPSTISILTLPMISVAPFPMPLRNFTRRRARKALLRLPWMNMICGSAMCSYSSIV